MIWPPSFVNAADVRIGQNVEHGLRRPANLTPVGVTTIGRLIRIGCAIMKSSSCVVGPFGIVEAEFGVGRALLAQQPRGLECPSPRSARPAFARDRRRLQIFDDLRLIAALADHGQRVARRAAGGIVVDGDGHVARFLVARRLTPPPASYQPLLRFTIRTTDSITGTSISTPTTVASAAPGLEAEQADRRGDRQLEEVAGADQRRRAGDAVRLAERAVEPDRPGPR